jgi:hypothetical protein
MRKLIFVLIIFIGIDCYSQELTKKQTLSFGTNYSFYFKEPFAGIDILSFADINGPSIYGEYTFCINDKLSVSPRISVGYAKLNNPMEEMSLLSSFALSATIDYCPFPNSFKNLKFNIGGLYHKINQVSSYSLSDNFYNGFYGNSVTYDSNKWGLIGSIKVDIIDTQIINLGVRYDLLSAFTDRNLIEFNSWQIGTYIGIKF